jgi:hypothetical protein
MLEPTAALFFTSAMLESSDLPPVLERMLSSRKGVSCSSGRACGVRLCVGCQAEMHRGLKSLQARPFELARVAADASWWRRGVLAAGMREGQATPDESCHIVCVGHVSHTHHMPTATPCHKLTCTVLLPAHCNDRALAQPSLGSSMGALATPPAQLPAATPLHLSDVQTKCPAMCHSHACLAVASAPVTATCQAQQLPQPKQQQHTLPTSLPATPVRAASARLSSIARWMGSASAAKWAGMGTPMTRPLPTPRLREALTIAAALRCGWVGG